MFGSSGVVDGTCVLSLGVTRAAKAHLFMIPYGYNFLVVYPSIEYRSLQHKSGFYPFVQTMAVQLRLYVDGKIYEVIFVLGE